MDRGHLNAKQPLGDHRIHSLTRKAAFAIHRLGMLCRNGRHPLCPRYETFRPHLSHDIHLTPPFAWR